MKGGGKPPLSISPHEGRAKPLLHMWNGPPGKRHLLFLNRSDGAVICPACSANGVAGHDDIRSTNRLIKQARYDAQRRSRSDLYWDDAPTIHQRGCTLLRPGNEAGNS